MKKPSPKNARALRLMQRTGATIKMHDGRWGNPTLGDGAYNSEASGIGKQIALQKRNVSKMIKDGYVSIVEEPDEDYIPTTYGITKKGELSLLSLNENDFKPTKPYFNSDEIKSILQSWYEADSGWIFLTELGIDGRRLDAYALGLWQSTKYASIGFEIKTSRSDLLNDLKNPYKQIPALKYCHQLYYVITKGLAKQTEFPPNVGLIEIWRNKSRHILIDAPWNEAVEPTWRLVGIVAQKSLKEYKKHYDWNVGDWVGEDRKYPVEERITNV